MADVSCLSALVLLSVLQTGVLATPELVFEPSINNATRIQFTRRQFQSTVRPYTERINILMDDYSNERAYESQLWDCAWARGLRPREQWPHACVFDVTANLGYECIPQLAYGYVDGHPCMFLMLTNEEGWIPEPFTSATVPDNIQDNWSPNAITVKCEGETAADRDNIGNISYYPSEGFNFKYFPYQSQTGYQRPMVAIRLENPSINVLVRITCRAFARNIENASVHFELLMN